MLQNNRVMGDKQTVLVVDDETGDLSRVRRVLAGEGYGVIEATSYREALDVFSRNAVDLLITDVALPMRTGTDLAKELLREKPRLKVLFMSGLAGAEVLQFAGIPNFDRFFLPKPFTSDQLLSIVRRIMTSSESVVMGNTRSAKGRKALTVRAGNQGPA